MTGDRVDNKTKVDVIKQEEQAIKAEKAAAKAHLMAEQELEAKKMEEETAAKAAEEAIVKVRTLSYQVKKSELYILLIITLKL